MLKPIIYPYNMTSRSGRQLAEALNTRRVYPNRNYRPRRRHVIVNWGNSIVPSWYPRAWNWMNDPHAVQRAVNKLECLDTLSEKGIAVPEYTVYPAEANAWLEQGHSVIERHIMNSHSGRGIVLTTPEEEEVGDAHFYTKYVGARREYRVHVFNGQVLLVVQKKRRNGTEQDDVVRNWHSGWVYAAEDITPLSEAAVHDAILAVNAMGLVFGAVDVITRRDSHYILEINTSPGLEGRTVGLYTNAIQAYLR